jgi:DNA-binding NarL/FixJ family response regulator
MQTVHNAIPQAQTAEHATEKIRVLVAHPNALVSAGLEAVLAQQPDVELVIGDASQSGLSRKQLESVSLVITECDTALAIGRSRPQTCRLLILTTDDSEISIRRAMEQGASGYLLFEATRDSILRAVRRVHAGQAEFDPIVSSKIARSVAEPALSPRQVEVLGLLMAGHSDKMIARRLGRSLETAKSHVKAILLKLGASCRTEAVAVARRRGLVATVPAMEVAPTDGERRRRRDYFSWGLGADARNSPSTVSDSGFLIGEASRVCPSTHTPVMTRARRIERTAFGPDSGASPVANGR